MRRLLWNKLAFLYCFKLNTLLLPNQTFLFFTYKDVTWQQEEIACSFCRGFVAQWSERPTGNQKTQVRSPAGLRCVFFVWSSCQFISLLVRPCKFFSVFLVRVRHETQRGRAEKTNKTPEINTASFTVLHHSRWCKIEGLSFLAGFPCLYMTNVL